MSDTLDLLSLEEPESSGKFAREFDEFVKIGLDIGGVLSKENSSEILIDVPDALESMHALRAKNYKLFIVSYSNENRSLIRHTKLIANGTAELFEEQYFVSDRSCKKDVLNYLACNVMIDDKESILNEVKRANENIVTILFQQYNKQKKRSHKLHLIANNWIEAIALLEGLQLEPYAPSKTTIYDIYDNITEIGPKTVFIKVPKDDDETGSEPKESA